MPTFYRPKVAIVEPGGGGVAAGAVVVVAAGAAVVWAARELTRIWVEVAIIAGGTAVIMGTWIIWMAVHFHRTSLPVNRAAKRAAIGQRTAVPAVPVRPAVAAPVVNNHYEVHHHYDERQLHVHVPAVPAAAEEAAAVEPVRVRRQIAPRAPVQGVVLERRGEARLRP